VGELRANEEQEDVWGCVRRAEETAAFDGIRLRRLSPSTSLALGKDDAAVYVAPSVHSASLAPCGETVDTRPTLSVHSASPDSDSAECDVLWTFNEAPRSRRLMRGRHRGVGVTTGHGYPPEIWMISAANFRKVGDLRLACG